LGQWEGEKYPQGEGYSSGSHQERNVTFKLGNFKPLNKGAKIEVVGSPGTCKCSGAITVLHPKRQEESRETARNVNGVLEQNRVQLPWYLPGRR
jgi:hypothetical protein